MPARKATEMSRAHRPTQNLEKLPSSAKFCISIKNFLSPPTFLQGVDSICVTLFPSSKKTDRAKDGDNGAFRKANTDSPARDDCRKVRQLSHDSPNPIFLNRGFPDPLRCHPPEIPTAPRVKYITSQLSLSDLPLSPKKIVSGLRHSKPARFNNQSSHNGLLLIGYAKILEVGSSLDNNRRIRRVKHFNHTRGGPKLSNPGAFELPRQI